MTTHFVTGFPGLLATVLVHRLLAEGDTVVRCLVHPTQAALAARRVEALAGRHPRAGDRIRLVEGDLTLPALGLAPGALEGVGEVHHLAAVYDLAVPRTLAEAVNVDGTRHMLEVAGALSTLTAFNHVSTCYVAGDAAAGFDETRLDLGQRFHNHYEETKQRSEVLVRDALDAGMPGRIFRPSVVVGDQATGATAKYDGLYFVIRFLMRWRRWAVLGLPAGAGDARFNAVPRDWVVAAMRGLGRAPATLGGTFHLADATPPRVPELIDALEALLERTVVRLPLPLAPARAAVRHVPGLAAWLGMPAEALDYFRHPGTFDVRRTLAALEGRAPPPPTLLDYLPRLVDFVRRHPDRPPESAVLPER
jgi:thioester reductase-like protein